MNGYTAIFLSVGFVGGLLGILMLSEDKRELESQIHSLSHSLAQKESSDFAERNGLRMAPLEGCSWTGDTQRCTSLLNDKPVAFHCSKDGCQFDCGGGK